ncbi:hypothetical protein D3C72_2064720 [compost metagenome]
MVRGTAQWHGQAPACQARQQHQEQAGIFARKQGRQPVAGAIVDHQWRLQADQVIGIAKPHSGLPQLVGIGHVLGVEDDDMLAPAERQRKIERLGFGAWQGIGHRH